MRLTPLFLYAHMPVGSDPLGNPINELVVIGESEGRFSSWKSEEIALDNRSITVNNRKILTPALKADLVMTDKIKFEGLYHTITEIRGDDYDRWRLLVVNRYGSDKP